MKLRSILLRMIFAWIPILPPPVLIGQLQHKDISLPASFLSGGVTAGGRQEIKIPIIDRKLMPDEKNSGG